MGRLRRAFGGWAEYALCCRIVRKRLYDRMPVFGDCADRRIADTILSHSLSVAFGVHQHGANVGRLFYMTSDLMSGGYRRHSKSDGVGRSTGIFHPHSVEVLWRHPTSISSI